MTQIRLKQTGMVDDFKDFFRFTCETKNSATFPVFPSEHAYNGLLLAIRSDEGLALETSAFESLYDG